ncbi:MAG TPA: SGNH/GDSL hydrolase family protein [Streptosporangiaceae bacterium]
MAETIASFAALGDSFTEGMNDAGPGGVFVGWADRTAEVLAARVPDFRYANLAVRGKLVREVLAEQIDPAIAMSPDLVSLAAGGNDILRRADVDNLAVAFDSAVTRLLAAGCRVLIFTGFDPRAFPVIRMLRGQIAAYNMHLRAIADERGCDLVDLWSMRVLCDPRAWSADRLHLTSDSHRRVAMRACEVLGVPVDGPDWRTPLPVAVRQPWLAARREDVRWAREYALPWVNRRLRRTSTGDEVPPKRPELLPVQSFLRRMPIAPRAHGAACPWRRAHGAGLAWRPA